MKLKLLKMVPAFLALSCMLSVTSCNTKSSNNKDVMSQGGTTDTKKEVKKDEFKSADGKESLFAPKSWINDPGLYDGALIQISNRMKEKYVVVLDEARTEDTTDFTLDIYTELVRELVQESMTNPSVTDIKDITVNGKNAKYFEIAGEVEDLNLKVSYFVSVVETDSKFYRVVGWTLTPKVEENKAEILEVMNSFTVNQ